MRWLSEDLRYLIEIKYHIATSMLLFLISILVGYMFAPLFAPEGMESMGVLHWIFEQLMKLPPELAVVAVYLNNLKTAAIAVLSGIGFGLLPIFVIVENGFVVGLASYLAMEFGGKSPYEIILSLVPHGLIEVPMIVLSVACGMRIGGEAMRALIRGEGDLRGEFLKGVRLFLHLVVPLLLAAAVVEIYVTARIVG